MEIRIVDVDELHSLDIEIPQDVDQMLADLDNKLKPLKEWLEFDLNAKPRNIKHHVFNKDILSIGEIQSMFWKYLSSNIVLNEKKVNIVWVRTNASRQSVEAALKSINKNPYYKESKDYAKIKSIHIIIKP